MDKFKVEDSMDVESNVATIAVSCWKVFALKISFFLFLLKNNQKSADVFPNPSGKLHNTDRNPQ